MINGGGSVLIQLIRQPFKTKQYAFIVPWNTFLHIGYIYMDENIEKKIEYENSPRNYTTDIFSLGQVIIRLILEREQYGQTYL